ncbi:hypothetical protein [Lysobacter panacisoli]|uniref:Secreted protein n=1 Tax=Lysobacter panacisoli TaxID=1255263 RepID=A0ABP9LPG3_9GAMM|nr:hypothetical protein [Lysobacter panacisoli]
MKPVLLRAALVLFALLVPAIAAAQSYVPIEQRLSADQLRSVGLTPVQLEQLNRMLREAQETTPVAPVAAPAAVAATTAASPAHADAHGAGRDPSSLIGFNDEPVRSRLKGPVSGWSPGTVFELENGQQWKVLKGALKLPKTLESPEIMVIPGVAGRWFLQVDEDMPKARVYRID